MVNQQRVVVALGPAVPGWKLAELPCCAGAGLSPELLPEGVSSAGAAACMARAWAHAGWRSPRGTGAAPHPPPQARIFPGLAPD